MLTRREMLRRVGAAGASGLELRSRAGAATAERSRVEFQVPRQACDCHVHVFDPVRFPYAAKRTYTPPPASVGELEDLLRALRLGRVVVVQASVYGIDNACTLEAIRRLGARARGIAVVDPAASGKALDTLAAGGIRGIRLNLETAGQFDPAIAGTLLEGATRQIAGRNWHIQLNTRLSVIAALESRLSQMPCPVVIDHFGGAKAAAGTAQAGFDSLLRLVRAGSVYVKISAAYRSSEQAPDYTDTGALARALVGANSDRIVWGTDWPHANSDFGRGRPLTEVAPALAIDDGRLLNQLPSWVPDAATRKKILVDNPARLYGY